MTTNTQNGQDELKVRLDRIQWTALIVGVVGLVLAIVGLFFDMDQLFRSYLFSYLFWLGISLGSLVWLLIYNLTGGRWGDAIRPLLESSVLLIGLMALLFIPLLFGLDRLYIWAQPELVAHDPLLQHKQPYLNVPFFMVRALLYFVIWGGCIALLHRWQRKQVEQPSLTMTKRLSRFSGPALGLYGITITFGAFDWLMSLDPYWYSTIFGVLIAAGQAVTALSLAIVVLAYLVQVTPFSLYITDRHIEDLGSLLLTSVIFWTYIAFIQYFIIWSGNIPEDVLWYLHRLEGGWRWIPLGLLFFHFIVPFALLLSSRLKRNPRRLAPVALLVLFSNLMHLFWLVAPTYAHGHIRFHWLDFVMPFFFGGLWIAAFVWQLRRQLRRQLQRPIEEVA